MRGWQRLSCSIAVTSGLLYAIYGLTSCGSDDEIVETPVYTIYGEVVDRMNGMALDSVQVILERDDELRVSKSDKNGVFEFSVQERSGFVRFERAMYQTGRFNLAGGALIREGPHTYRLDVRLSRSNEQGAESCRLH